VRPHTRLIAVKPACRYSNTLYNADNSADSIVSNLSSVVDYCGSAAGVDARSVLQAHCERMTKRETLAKNRPNNRAARSRSAERGQLPAEVRLYDDLVGAIIDQRLPAGTRLNEANLAKAYRLARPRVRSVLSRLAANNIIELKLNFGAFVRRPSQEEARNVYQTRRFLEAGVIQSIAEDPPAYNLTRLRELVVAERRAYRHPKPVYIV